MHGSSDSAGPVRHFVAVNHHRFHDVRLVEWAVRSAVEAAERLRAARPEEGARVVLFYQAEGLGPALLARLQAVEGLALVPLPPGSNGAGLNAQMEAAARAGAAIFYRVDADDPVHPDRFVRQARVLEETGADVAGGGLHYVTLDGGAGMDVLPRARPGARDYLANAAMLHPTLAFRLERLRAAGVAYWERRLEDKHLGLQIARAGLTLVNDPAIYGEYNLDPKSRSSLTAARMNLSLNLAYLRHARRLDLVPAALGLFLLSALLPAQWLRRLRQRLRRDRGLLSAPGLRACSGCAGGSDTGRTARQPRG